MKWIIGQLRIIYHNIEGLYLGTWHTKFHFEWLIRLNTRAKSLGVRKNL